MRITFTVPGEPHGKGRPRVVNIGGRTVAYTPEETAAYENLVKIAYYREGGRTVFDEAVYMLIECWTALPRSATASRKTAMLEGRSRPTKKPDLDNVIKAVCDALNGVAYRDDAQVVEVTAKRYWGESAEVRVTMSDEEIRG